MSRVHQGKSSSYQRKIKVRQDRTFDRFIFSCAKHFHDKRVEAADDDSEVDRAFIRRWKSKIYNYLKQDKNITLDNFDHDECDKIYKMVLNRFAKEPLY